MIDKLYRGKDGVIRAVGLRTLKSYIECSIQYLYPLELHYDVEKQPLSANTNTSTLDTKEYRPRRIAAARAEIRMKDINDEKSMKNNDHQLQ